MALSGVCSESANPRASNDGRGVRGDDERAGSGGGGRSVGQTAGAAVEERRGSRNGDGEGRDPDDTCRGMDETALAGSVLGLNELWMEKANVGVLAVNCVCVCPFH